MILLLAAALLVAIALIDGVVLMQLFSILHDAGVNVPAIGFKHSFWAALMISALITRPNLNAQKASK